MLFRATLGLLYNDMGQAIPQGQAGVISRFALAHRGKPLIVVGDTHPILDDGEEWEASPEA